jgi:hypothetical protein
LERNLQWCWWQYLDMIKWDDHNYLRHKLRNQVVSSLVCLWIQIQDGSVVSPFIFVSFGESYLLVSWCAGGRCGMVGSDEDHGRSRRPIAADWGWSHRLGTWWPDDREVRWCRVRYAPCTWRWGAQVSWLSLKTNVDCLLVVWPQNYRDGFLWFGLKTGGDSFLWFASKPVSMVSPGLASKPAVGFLV